MHFEGNIDVCTSLITMSHLLGSMDDCMKLNGIEFVKTCHKNINFMVALV